LLFIGLIRKAELDVAVGNPPPAIPAANGQAAVEFPVRSGDEVSLNVATREELPRDLGSGKNK
jgi:hypothetical protein